MTEAETTPSHACTPSASSFLPVLTYAAFHACARRSRGFTAVTSTASSSPNPVTFPLDFVVTLILFILCLNFLRTYLCLRLEPELSEHARGDCDCSWWPSGTQHCRPSAAFITEADDGQARPYAKQPRARKAGRGEASHFRGQL